MAGKFLDLHMHSLYSDDGEFSPAELVQKCKEKDIKIMSIADHNCTRANKEGREAAQSVGITYISAIEIDCTFQGVNMHVLGYGINDQSEDFDEIEKNIQEQSLIASQLMLIKTQELGFLITEYELKKLAEHSYWKDSWTGEMFAEVLLHKPEYQDHDLLRPYRLGGERGDNPYVNFYWDYYSQGKPCYAKLEFPSLAQAIDVIHRNGGYSVLAHPGLYLNNQDSLLESIIQTGLDGIEAFSSYHSVIQSTSFYNKAIEHNLFVTCGSDYHGKTKPAISLAEHGCIITDNVMRKQLDKILHNNLI